MSKVKTNAGLLSAGILLEDAYGVKKGSFPGSQVLRLKQGRSTPYDIDDNYNKTDIPSTTGYQLGNHEDQVLGQRNVTASLAHNIGLNDFVSILKLYAPNYTAPSGVLYSTTITAVVDAGNYSTVTVADATGIKVGHRIVIGSRVDSTEDGAYIVTALSGSDVTIDAQIDAGDDTGTFEASVSAHEFLVEDISDCLTSYNDQSGTLYLPDRFPRDTACGRGGYVVTGVIGTTLNMDLEAGTYSADIIAKAKEKSEDVPYLPADYKLPEYTDGYFRTSGGASLQKWNSTTSEWEELDTIALTAVITRNIADDDKARKAGEMSEAIVDGVTITGIYETLHRTLDTSSNISNDLYDNRGVLQSGEKYRVALEHPTGEAIYIDGYITFMNETVVPEEKGHRVTADWAMKYDVSNLENAKITLVNSYNEDLTSYL